MVDGSAFLSALGGVLTGVVTGSGLLVLLGRRLVERLSTLERRVEEDQEKRLQRMESDLAQGCKRHQVEAMDRDIEDTKRRVGLAELAVGDLKNSFGEVRVTVANQAGAFRDFSGKLERYMEDTARQDERIGATDKHLQELHRTVSTHRDDRSIHHG